MNTGNFSELPVVISECQSSYRAERSTETSLLKVVIDISRPCAIESPPFYSRWISPPPSTQPTTASRSTVSHVMLASAEVRSSGYSHFSAVAHSTSVSATRGLCRSGVPQGSVLGPLLFAVYLSPLANVIEGHITHNLHQHQYADDTQLYMAVSPSDGGSLHAISSCVDNVCR